MKRSYEFRGEDQQIAEKKGKEISLSYFSEKSTIIII